LKSSHQLSKYDWINFSSKQRSFYFTKSSRGLDSTGRFWPAGRMFDTPDVQ